MQIEIWYDDESFQYHSTVESITHSKHILLLLWHIYFRIYIWERAQVKKQKYRSASSAISWELIFPWLIKSLHGKLRHESSSNYSRKSHFVCLFFPHIFMATSEFHDFESSTKRIGDRTIDKKPKKICKGIKGMECDVEKWWSAIKTKNRKKQKWTDVDNW